MPPHPRTPLPPHLATPAEHDPDGRATAREEYDELDRLALMTSAGDHSPHGPAKSCCRSADTDARLTRMGDPYTYTQEVIVPVSDRHIKLIVEMTIAVSSEEIG